MCKVFHREAGVNIVTDGILTCAKCFIERLGLLMLLMAHLHVQMFHRGAGINNVTDDTLTCADCFIEGLELIMLLMAHSHVQSVS